VAINTVVEMEVAHYLIKSLGAKGKRKMDLFLSFPMEVVDLDHILAKRSIELPAKFSQTGIGGRDATILAAMEELGIKKLMTHDRAFKRIDSILCHRSNSRIRSLDIDMDGLRLMRPLVN